jgi:hypothetical protein
MVIYTGSLNDILRKQKAYLRQVDDKKIVRQVLYEIGS